MLMQPMRVLMVTAMLAGAGSACVDLDIVNNNDPDRDRALAEPGDVEALIAGSFGAIFRGTQNRASAAQLFPNHATMFTTTSDGFAARENVREPRFALDNSGTVGATTGPWGYRHLWVDFNEAVSSASDGLRTLAASGIVLQEGGQDMTPRAQAYAKFIQGVGWGFMANIFDQAYYVPETEAYRSDAVGQGRDTLRPADELLARALQALDEAISIAQQNTFTFPPFAVSRLWFSTPDPLTNTDLVQLANTMAARFLVLQARTPQERAQVDWNRVLQYTENGLTFDFETTLASGFRSSVLYSRAQNNTVGCGACYRLDTRLIGQADISGAYQAWLSAPISERNRFEIVTPDRRITGPTPTSNGAYTRYRADDNGFIEGVGTFLFSAYQWARHAHINNNPGTASNIGTAPLATADENRLLRAEALLRTGSPGGAAELINVTRTREQRIGATMHPGLPPVTAAGVPEAQDCVPRTDSGECGSLMVALRYERMIELMMLDAVRGWLESRGFGLLVDDSWVQAPVPGNELEILGLPVYTFGGPGGHSAAVYAPVTTP